MLIIPDTNFLIYLTKYKLWHKFETLYPRYRFLVLPQVIYELEKLTKEGKAKEKEDASLTLQLIHSKTKAKKGYVDNILIKTVIQLKKDKQKFIIATMDKNIIKKLKVQGIRVLGIRQKKYFIVT